jgi:hypothetical protein
LAVSSGVIARRSLQETTIVRGLLFSICLTMLAACGSDTAEYNHEDEIRDWVARGEAAAEEKDRGELLDMISEDYADGRGNNHEGIGNMLRVYFFRQNSIALLTSIDNIAMMGDTAAMAYVTVGMAGTNSGAIGLNADAYKFEFELEKRDDEWLLIGARWGELGGELR